MAKKSIYLNSEAEISLKNICEELKVNPSKYISDLLIAEWRSISLNNHQTEKELLKKIKLIANKNNKDIQILIEVLNNFFLAFAKDDNNFVSKDQKKHTWLIESEIEISKRLNNLKSKLI